MTQADNKTGQQPDPSSRRSTSQQVWDAIVDLQNKERLVTRRSVVDLTGLKPATVDDHLERLVTRGLLRRMGAGVLEVVEVFPPARSISKTLLPSGLVKLEIGDVVLDLTPKEARMVSDLFRSDLLSLTEIESGNRALVRMSELVFQMGELKRQIGMLQKKRGDDDQMGLLPVGP